MHSVIIIILCNIWVPYNSDYISDVLIYYYLFGYTINYNHYCFYLQLLWVMYCFFFFKAIRSVINVEGINVLTPCQKLVFETQNISYRAWHLM